MRKNNNHEKNHERRKKPQYTQKSKSLHGSIKFVQCCSVMLYPPPHPIMAEETSSHATQEQEATVLFNKGVKLDHLHRSEEALAVYNKLITDFGDSHYTMAKALLNEGNDLEILHRIGQARADWEELIYRFKDNSYVIDQDAVAKAQHNLAITKKKTFLERLSSYF